MTLKVCMCGEAFNPGVDDLQPGSCQYQVPDMIKLLTFLVGDCNIARGDWNWDDNCSKCKDGIETVVRCKAEVDQVEAKVREMQRQLLAEMRGLQELINILQIHLFSLGQRARGCKIGKFIMKAVGSVDVIRKKRGQKLVVIYDESLMPNEVTKSRLESMGIKQEADMAELCRSSLENNLREKCYEEYSRRCDDDMDVDMESARGGIDNEDGSDFSPASDGVEGANSDPDFNPKSCTGQWNKNDRPPGTQIRQLPPNKLKHKGKTGDGKPRPYSCEHCGRRYRSVKNLKRHLSWDHNIGSYKPKTSHVCSVCGYIAGAPLRLQNHMRVHEKDKLKGRNEKTPEQKPLSEDPVKNQGSSARKYKHHCSTCGYSARTSGRLSQHKLVHARQELKDEIETDRQLEKALAREAKELSLSEDSPVVYLSASKLAHKGRTSDGKERLFSCEYCGRRYTLQKSVTRHLARAHKLGPETPPSKHRCPICAYLAITPLRLRQHLNVHKRKKEVDDDEIQRILQVDREISKKRLPRQPTAPLVSPPIIADMQVDPSSQQLQNPPSNRPYVCYVCHRCYTARRILDRHLGWIHGIGTHKRASRNICQTCNYDALTPLRLRRHMETHIPPEARLKTKCQLCNKTVRTLYIDVHLKYNCEFRETSSEQTQQVVCEECGQTLKNKVSLFHHKRQLHQLPKEEPSEKVKPLHVCHLCGKCGFKRDSDFRTHLDRHSSKRDFVCDLCGYPFKEKRHLGRHRRKCDGTRRIQNRPSRLIEVDKT